MLPKLLLALCAGCIACAAIANPDLGSQNIASPPVFGGNLRFMFDQPHLESFTAQGGIDFSRWSGAVDHRPPGSWNVELGHHVGEHHGGRPFEWHGRPGQGHDWHHEWHPGHTSPNAEPSTYAMMGLGLLLMGLFARRHNTG